MSALPFKLRDLPAGTRLALSLLVLVNLGGYAASGLHMSRHHENRDGREGVSMTDLKAAYHGVVNRSPLLTALERGHPEDVAEESPGDPLSEEGRRVLIDWLEGERITEDYDNLDLAPAPADVLADSCVGCHSARASEELRADPPLFYWEDVREVAFSNEIHRTGDDILLASTHTHAIALASITLLVILLMLCTGWPSAVQSTLALLASLGLAGDLAAWWLARESAAFVYAIVGFGWMHAAGMLLMMLLVLIDLWRPRAG